MNENELTKRMCRLIYFVLYPTCYPLVVVMVRVEDNETRQQTFYCVFLRVHIFCGNFNELSLQGKTFLDF